MTMFAVAFIGCAILGMIGAGEGRRAVGGDTSGWVMLLGALIGLAVYLHAVILSHVASRKRDVAKWKEGSLMGLSLILILGSPVIAFIISKMINKMM